MDINIKFVFGAIAEKTPFTPLFKNKKKQIPYFLKPTKNI